MRRHFTDRVPIARSAETLGQIRRRLSEGIRKFDSIHYVYVVGEEGTLIGVLSIREVFRFSEQRKAGDVCTRKNLVTVHPETRQERAAYLALRHELKAIPVVSPERKFLGVITGDTLLHILYKETHEDVLKRAGISRRHPLFDNILTMPLLSSITHRLPWLIVGLVGGIFAANIIGLFERTLQENIILAAFMPLVVYMGSATGTQMEAFIIRDLAMDHRLPFGRYIIRQLAVVVSIAILCAALLYGVSLGLHGPSVLNHVLAVALFAAITSSMLTGLVIPYLLSRFRMDPANASGPVGTIVQDILSILMYFVIASAMLPSSGA